MLTVSQISTYPLNIAGHDAQNRCATVLHVEPAYNWPTEYQAHSRVYRIGQRGQVEIVRLFTEKTYQEIHEYHMVSKASSMFAAFQSLKNAVDQVDKSVSREDMAMSAFGICRRRVKFAENISSAKLQAKERNTR